MLSPWEILRGKFGAALYATVGVVAAAGLWIGLAAFAAPGNLGPADLFRRGLLPFAVLVTTWVFVTAVGACASILTRRTLAALVGSYVALFVWFVGLPALATGTLGSPSTLSVATQPYLAALAAAKPRSAEMDNALLSFFLIHAGLTLAVWHAARLEVEVWHRRDP
jgi:hypothetical protein